jgi:hypothetical protein
MSARFLYPIAGAALLLGSGLASAQTTAPKTTPSTPPAASNAAKPDATKPDAAKMTLTEQQAKSWVDKAIYSSDNKEIGEVAAFKRGADNVVLEMHADVGGALGMGETRVKLMPEQFKLQGDRVVLNLTEAQVKDLPKIKS